MFIVPLITICLRMNLGNETWYNCDVLKGEMASVTFVAGNPRNDLMVCRNVGNVVYGTRVLLMYGIFYHRLTTFAVIL